MPINSKHPSYKESQEKTQKVTDFYHGSWVVKGEGDKYLPRLSGQTAGEYNAYLTRAYLTPALKPTSLAIIGAIARKQGVIDSPIADIEKDFDGHGCSIHKFSEEVILSLLLAGGGGVLVEWDEVNRMPKAVQYKRDSIINWGDDFIVLAQSYIKANIKDKYEPEIKTEYLELTFDEFGNYIQNIYREEGRAWKLHSSITPTNRGEGLTEIPFVFYSSGDVSSRGFAESDPVLLNLADVNQDQYLLSTDQRHGLHWTALPTLFLFGELKDAEGKSKTIKVGAGSSNHIEDSDARAELLEFNGSGLASIKSAIDDDLNTMAAIGAKMLSDNSGGVKSAETSRIEASAETATLSVIANTLDLCVNGIFRIMDGWTGLSGSSYTANRDFIDIKLDPNALMALLRTWQSGGMSLDSFLYNLERGELLPKDISREHEADRIESSQPFSEFEESTVV